MSATKVRILNEALALFSVKGYDGVSMAHIADRVGIKAASIYKHYAGKEDIFNNIVIQFEIRTEEIFKAALLENKDYRKISKEMLTRMVSQTFKLYAEEPFLSRCRRLFIISSFDKPQIGNLYTKYFIEMPIVYQSEIFMLLNKERHGNERNAMIMAYHFYTPILTLLQEYDYKKITVKEALSKIEIMVNQFVEVYQL